MRFSIVFLTLQKNATAGKSRLRDGENSPLPDLRNLISTSRFEISFEDIDGLLRIAEHLNRFLGVHPFNLHFFNAVLLAAAVKVLDVPSGAIGIHMRVLHIIAFYKKLCSHPCRFPADGVDDFLVGEKFLADPINLEVLAVKQATNGGSTSMQCDRAHPSIAFGRKVAGS